MHYKEVRKINNGAELLGSDHIFHHVDNLRHILGMEVCHDILHGFQKVRVHV